MGIRLTTAWVAVTVVLFGHAAAAADIAAKVRDGEGAPLADAVVFAVPADGRRLPAHDPVAAVIDQIGAEFRPFVTPVEVGAEVVITNADQFAHNVYSVFGAKVFQIELTREVTAPPVRIEVPGVVLLGCSIHDWMVAYVFAVSTPYFAVTDQSGVAIIRGLPVGATEVRVWHPGVRDDRPPPLAIESSAAEIANVEFDIQLRPEPLWNIHRDPNP